MAKKDNEQPRVVTATDDYDGVKEDELSFDIGERIQIVGKVERGWYEGVKFSDKKLGVFPELYVEADKDVKPLFLYCKALNDFSAKEREKLSYKKNDFFEKLRPTTRPGCMKGTLVSNQTRGYFEVSNVLFLTKEEAGAQMTLIQKREDLMASLDKNADKMDKSSAHVDPPQKTSFDQPTSQTFSFRGSGGSFPNNRGTAGQMSSVREDRGQSDMNEEPNPSFFSDGNCGNGYNSSVDEGFEGIDGFGNKPSVNNEETFGNDCGGSGFYSAQHGAQPSQKKWDGFDQSSNNQGFHGQIANTALFAADNGFYGNCGGFNTSMHNGFFENHGNGSNSSDNNRVGFGDNNGCGNNHRSFHGRGDSKPENEFELNENAMVAVANNADPSGNSAGADVKNEKPTDARKEDSSTKHDPQETEKKQVDGTAQPNNDPSEVEVPKPFATAVPKAPEVVAPVVAASTRNDANAGLVVAAVKENNGAASEIMNGPFQGFPGVIEILNGIKTQLSAHPELRSLKIFISGDQTEDGQISMKTNASCEYHQKI